MKRRLFSLLLCVCMVLTMLPVLSVAAAETTTLASYYGTNKVGTGVKKTITVDGDISDWNSSMLIAQGTANDDPRVYRPNSMYEIPIDMYALYAAYDNENLYLMWEMTNVQDVVAPNDTYPLSQGILYQTMNVPFFIAIDTGDKETAIGNNGALISGGTIWDSGITFGQSFNKLIAISTNGANGPFLYGGNSQGLNPKEELAYKQVPMSFNYGLGILSENVYGIDKAYGEWNNRLIGDMCNEDAAWVDFNTMDHNSATMDFHYEMSISLEALGVTYADVSQNGLGILVVATMGKSGMDCLPYDLSMNDKADLDDAAGSQENNSFEKSDEDHITASFARVGGSADPTDPTEKPSEEPTEKPTETPSEPEEPEEPEEPITPPDISEDPELSDKAVYAIDSTKWGTVSAYLWTEGSGDEKTWPGTAMTKADFTVNGYDVYEYTVNGSYSSIIFNNNGNGAQTSDLTLKLGQIYDLATNKWYASVADVPVVDHTAINVYLPGAFNGWDTTANQFKLASNGSDIAYSSVELEANTKYEFKIINNGAWTSCSTAITDTVEGLTFGSNVGDNCSITTKTAGTYVFSYNTSTGKVGVQYPCAHQWKAATCTTPKTCTKCGETEGKELGHNYVDGVCTACGAADPDYVAPAQKFDIDFAQVILGNALNVNFAFPADAQDDWTSCYAVATKTYADGREDLTVTVPVSEWKTATINEKAHYYFSFSNVSGKEMADNIYVTIYNADDEAISNQYTESIRSYVMRILDDQNDETRTMLVDMLNYGSAAQNTYTYGADDLANSQLSAAQKAYGSTTFQECTDSRVMGAKYQGTRLVLKNSILMQFGFSGLTADMTAKVEFTNHRGTKISETVTPVKLDNGSYAIEVNQIVAADGRIPVTVTVYDADGNVYGTATDSMESYIARMGTTDPLYAAIMMFSDAAYAYLH